MKCCVVSFSSPKIKCSTFRNDTFYYTNPQSVVLFFFWRTKHRSAIGARRQENLKQDAGCKPRALFQAARMYSWFCPEPLFLENLFFKAPFIGLIYLSISPSARRACSLRVCLKRCTRVALRWQIQQPCRHGNRDVNYDGQVSDSFYVMTSKCCWVVACLRSSVYYNYYLKGGHSHNGADRFECYSSGRKLR